MSKDIRLAKKILESAGYRVLRKYTPNYEEYTPAQFDELLSSISNTVDSMSLEIADIPYEDRDDILDAAEELKDQLLDIEDYLTEEQYAKKEQISSAIDDLGDIEYEGPIKPMDPYVERGLRREDFY